MPHQIEEFKLQRNTVDTQQTMTDEDKKPIYK